MEKKHKWVVYVLLSVTIVFVIPPLLVSGIVTLNILPTCSNGAIAPNGNLAQCGLVAGSNGQLVNPNNPLSNINQYFYCSPQQLSAGYVIQINSGQMTCVPPNQIKIYSNSNTASIQSYSNSNTASIQSYSNSPTTTPTQTPTPNISTTQNTVSTLAKIAYCPDGTVALNNNLQNCQTTTPTTTTPTTNSTFVTIAYCPNGTAAPNNILQNCPTNTLTNTPPPPLPTNGYGQLYSTLPPSNSLIPIKPLSLIPSKAMNNLSFLSSLLSFIANINPNENVWWHTTYLSINTNDYHGQFIAPSSKNIDIAKFSESDILMVLPLNLNIGNPNNSIWFQFAIDSSQYYYGNLNPPHLGYKSIMYLSHTSKGQCGVQSSFIDDDISEPSPFTQGLSYVEGDSYHFDFYADQNNPNHMVFLIVDDTKGGINSNAYWWNEWQVPTINLLYDQICFSPAVSFEGHSNPNESIFQGTLPTFQINENIGLTGISQTIDSDLRPNTSTSTYQNVPSGIITSATPSGNGNLIWQVESNIIPTSIPQSISQPLPSSNVFINWISNLTTLLVNSISFLFEKH